MNPSICRFQEKWRDLPQVVETSIKSPVADNHGKIWLGRSTATGRAIWKSSWFYFSLVLGAIGMLFLMHRIRVRKA